MNNDRKNVVALAACQALLVMNNATMISIGTLAADTLATNKMLVTIPATAYIIGGGLTTMPISLFMKRHGRRAGFMVGCLFGMVGGTLAAAAMLAHNFWMLGLAALVSGIYTGSGGFYRFAAADQPVGECPQQGHLAGACRRHHRRHLRTGRQQAHQGPAGNAVRRHFSVARRCWRPSRC